MAKKHRGVFLYLAIACFLGIAAIFVFDGYTGTYDTVYVTANEYEQEIGAEFWQDQSTRDKYPYHTGAELGEPILFRYRIDNRRPSAYAATVEATLWKSNAKVADLLQEDIQIGSFDYVELSWTLPADAIEETGQYTVRITRGGTELGQGIIIDFRSPQGDGFPQKALSVR